MISCANRLLSWYHGTKKKARGENIIGCGGPQGEGMRADIARFAGCAILKAPERQRLGGSRKEYDSLEGNAVDGGDEWAMWERSLGCPLIGRVGLVPDARPKLTSLIHIGAVFREVFLEDLFVADGPT